MDFILICCQIVPCLCVWNIRWILCIRLYNPSIHISLFWSSISFEGFHNKNVLTSTMHATRSPSPGLFTRNNHIKSKWVFAVLLSTIMVKDEGMHAKSMLWWCVIVMDVNLMNFQFCLSVGVSVIVVQCKCLHAV